MRPNIGITCNGRVCHIFVLTRRVAGAQSAAYLRRLQNYWLDMGWLADPILPKKKFPKIFHKEKRAITWEEHCQIIAPETSCTSCTRYQH